MTDIHAFNPEGSLLRKRQLRMLEILKSIDTICRDNSIPYILSSGTALGACRHGGFIPWDDDLDIELLKEDYDKLLPLLEANLPEDMALQTHQTDCYYYIPFAKVRCTNMIARDRYNLDENYRFRGVFVDIFPLEQNWLPFSQIATTIQKLTMRVSRLSNRYAWLKNPLLNLLYLLSYKALYPCFRFLSHLFPTQTVRHVLGAGYNAARKREELFPPSALRFEGYEFLGPNNIDAYLKRLYGPNYMTPPPVEKIEMHSIESDVEDC
ncbi:MAG: LicD family protein [Bacteroidales bacterium]|jgi:lipopolysaccharide cholinephosphotransferase|nr:LicD family protein [Bacteroidales bacterium]MDD3161511.1 LicD family protein [Bacteroidales bacterium]